MNPSVTRRSNIYSKSTEIIQLEQNQARTQARHIQLMAWLLALLLPLVTGVILANLFY